MAFSSRSILIHFRAVQMILSLSVTYLFDASYASGKSLPEQVKEYVDHSIPLSRKIAKNHANLSENGIILDRLSEIQSYVAMISANQTIFDESARSLQFMVPIVVDVNSIEKEELEKAFKLTMLLTQMNASYEHLSEQINKFDALNDSFQDVCEKYFDLYDTSKLGFSFNENNPVNFQIYLDLSTPAIYLLNELSVHVLGKKLISTGGTVFGMNAPMVALVVTFLKSTIDTITAKIERQEIQSHLERLKREVVKNEEYRQYAKEACIQYRDQGKVMLKKYEELKDTIQLNFDSYSSTLQNDRINAQLNSLTYYITTFDQKVLDAIKLKVRNWATAAFGEVRTEDSYQESLSLNLKRLQLARMQCGDGFDHVQWLRQKLVQNQALELKLSDAMIQKTNQTLSERFEACPIEAI